MNQFIFVMEKCCVFSDVGAECLNIVLNESWLQRLRGVPVVNFNI
jgi:hypothetical protein